jgi:hypothetical protein
MEIATKPLVMASEIAGLEPLRAYIKQLNRVVPVKFAWVPKRPLQPEFIERKMVVPEARQLPGTELALAPEAVLVTASEPRLVEPEAETHKSAFKKKEGATREWKPVD